MECPHCNSTLSPSLPSCGQCGFDLAKLRSRLGSHWVKLERLTDSAGCLSLKDVRSIEGALDELERRFPQIFFAAYFGVLPQGINVAEAGFWLLNHAAFGSQELARQNEYGIVLIIDPAAGRAGFSIGYAIEPWLDKQALNALLIRMSRSLAQSEYARALRTAVGHLDASLRAAGKARPRTPLPALDGDLGLERLGGHVRKPAQARTPS